MAVQALPPIDLSQIVRRVFTDMTPLEVWDEEPAPWAGADLILAAIQMNGEMSGRLELFGDSDFVTQVAAILTGRHPGDVPRSDACEVWGELANVIAGHAQHDAPEPKSLGMPVVKPCGPASVDAAAGRTVWTVVEGVPVATVLTLDLLPTPKTPEEGP